MYFCRRHLLSFFSLTATVLVSGCSTVSSSRLEDCRLRLKAVQSENEQLRDVALSVRNQNRDMSLRAVEDSRRLRSQDEAIDRLEKSVMEYQGDRERMAALLDELRSQVKTAASDAPVTAQLESSEKPLQNRIDPGMRRTNYAPDSPTGPAVNLDDHSVRFPSRDLFDSGSQEISIKGQRTLEQVSKSLQNWFSGDSSASRVIIFEKPGLFEQTESSVVVKARKLWLRQARLDQVRRSLADRMGCSLDKFDIIDKGSNQPDLPGSTDSDLSEIIVRVSGAGTH